VTKQAFDAETAAARVVEALRPLASTTRAVQEKRYLKSDLDFLGVGVPGIRKVVTEAARSYDGLDRPDVRRDIPGSRASATRRPGCLAAERIQGRLPQTGLTVKGRTPALRTRFSEVSV